MDYSDFTPEELVAAVKAALQDKSNAMQTILSADRSLQEMGDEIAKRCKALSEQGGLNVS